MRAFESSHDMGDDESDASVRVENDENPLPISQMEKINLAAMSITIFPFGPKSLDAN